MILVFFLISLMMDTPIAAQNQQVHQYEKSYFDKDWKLCKRKRHKFYRIAKRVDSLLYITDYYANGNKQFEGKWFWRDSTDLNIRFLGNIPDQNSLDTVVFYDKKGLPKHQVVYLPIGVPCNTTTNYVTAHTEFYTNGKPSCIWQEIRGKEEGLVTWLAEADGTPTATLQMKNGKAHGKETLFYEDDTIYSITEYVEGEKHGYYTEYYNYPLRMKYREKYVHGELEWRESY